MAVEASKTADNGCGYGRSTRWAFGVITLVFMPLGGWSLAAAAGARTEARTEAQAFMQKSEDRIEANTERLQDVREGQARIEERLRSIDEGLKRVQRTLEGQ